MSPDLPQPPSSPFFTQQPEVDIAKNQVHSFSSGQTLWAPLLESNGPAQASLHLPLTDAASQRFRLVCFPLPLPFLRPLPHLSLASPAIYPHAPSRVRLPSPDHLPCHSRVPCPVQLCACGVRAWVHVQVYTRRPQEGTEYAIVSFSALFPWDMVFH